jgi:gas vesicle protein
MTAKEADRLTKMETRYDFMQTDISELKALAKESQQSLLTLNGKVDELTRYYASGNTHLKNQVKEELAAVSSEMKNEVNILKRSLEEINETIDPFTKFRKRAWQILIFSVLSIAFVLALTYKQVNVKDLLK